MSEKNIVEKALDADMASVTFRLLQPFVNFLKDYLSFFGDERTLEDLCRKIIYSETCRLYRELDEYSQQKTSYLSDRALFDKHGHIAIAAFEDPEEK